MVEDRARNGSSDFREVVENGAALLEFSGKRFT